MEQDKEVRFPSSFVWGAATSAYQIEGAVAEDGRGESVWDRFCATPGRVRNGESGAVADDHYHRYREDVALMRQLGLRGYRFSVAWPRVLPLGRGMVNTKGLDFYDRLVDELLHNEIEPYVTLYHWDLPQALEDEGGWLSRATTDAFVEFTEATVLRLGDRVKTWITHNEPSIASWYGYGWGIRAPGRTEGEAGAVKAAHHLLLSHGQAVDVIRRDVPTARVGITLFLTPTYPVSENGADVAAAQYVDGMHNRWFLDPIFRSEYPADMLEAFQQHLPREAGGDLQLIGRPIDFLGVNYYFRTLVRAGATGEPARVRPDQADFTDMGFELYPDGLFHLLPRLHREYGPKRIYITENGASFTDVPIHNGSVRDPERQRYIQRHLEAVARSIEMGVPVDGYFVWSLLDNFEWESGYGRRFGLVFVDYPTLRRIPKTSFEWYRSLIAKQHATAWARAPDQPSGRTSRQR